MIKPYTNQQKAPLATTMKSKFFFPLLFLAVTSSSEAVFAHGANVEYRRVQAVQIDAAYAGGQPMKKAQVTVYAPDNPTTPWATGTTDEQGNFTFVPDATQPGNWEIKVRQAGHGDIVTIPVESNAANESTTQTAWLSGSEGEYTSSTQKILLGAAGVWGFFGTALFFARRRID